MVLLFSGEAQESPQVMINGEVLQRLTIEFIIEGQNRGIDLTDKILSLDTITYVTQEKKFLGLFKDNNIYINTIVLNDYAMFKAVVFHELFHANGVPHCHEVGTHLMCSLHPFGWSYGTYLDPLTWKNTLDVEFDKLKEL